MSRYIPPSPFYTFEPLRHDPLDMIPLIQASQGGDHSEIKAVEGIPTSILSLEDGEKPTRPGDDAIPDLRGLEEKWRDS